MFHREKSAEYPHPDCPFYPYTSNPLLCKCGWPVDDHPRFLAYIEQNNFFRRLTKMIPRESVGVDRWN